MPAQPAQETAEAPRTQAPLEGLVFGSLEGARAFAGAGAEAFSRGLNRSSRAALAAQVLTADYADRMLKLSMSALPRPASGAPGKSEWLRPMAYSSQWADIYVSYLRDCGQVVAAALRDETP